MAKAPPPKTPLSPEQPTRPANLPHGRWLGDFLNLKAAEKKLVAACAKGEPCIFNKENRPTQYRGAPNIRAGLIRFLLLGGDAEHPVHEQGVSLEGAWITGELSLNSTRVKVRLGLRHCHIVKPITARNAKLETLSLNGSKIAGLDAAGMVVRGSVHLCDCFEATSTVRLDGAHIGGQLNCKKGKFQNTPKKPIAIRAGRIVVQGSMMLNSGFKATGEVRLVGAQIDGKLSCSGGAFTNTEGDKRAISAGGIIVKGSVFLNKDADGTPFIATGEVRLVGARIGGKLSCEGGFFSNPGGNALDAHNATVKGDLQLKNATFNNPLKLTEAQLGCLNDEDFTWPKGNSFDGLRYDQIDGDTSAKHRRVWLESQAGYHAA